MVLLLVPAWLYGGCGGDDCVALCEEAQDGGCTYIDQPCADVCAAVEQIDPCVDDLEGYLDCLGSVGDVCESECGSKEINLTACVTSYCSQNPETQPCQDLVVLE